MSKTLTYKKRIEYLTFIVNRDGGLKCFYCTIPLKLDDYLFEHLDNNRDHNGVENLVLACRFCNDKKKNDFDMQITAMEKLRQNQTGHFVGEKIPVEDADSNEVSTEIAINMSNFQITEQYLTERILTDGSIGYSDALNSCVYLCKRKTGHGSQQSIRNHLATLSCSEGPFVIIRDDDKKKIIVTRKN